MPVHRSIFSFLFGTRIQVHHEHIKFLVSVDSCSSITILLKDQKMSRDMTEWLNIERENKKRKKTFITFTAIIGSIYFF